MLKVLHLGVNNPIKQNNMAITKNRKDALSKFDTEKVYNLDEASKIVKDITKVKFDSSVDIAVKLGVDPKKANQMVRGTVSLPHGTGKDVKVLVLCTPDKENDAKEAGADFVGLDDYIDKIKKGWTDVDVIITMPSVMGKVGALGRILGPRGLMPNPKTGTVTMNISQAVTDVKAGKIDFKVEKNGIIHAAIGKASFESTKIAENANELVTALMRLKPSSSKGLYVKSIVLSTTMSPGVKVEPKSISV
jgi:large subunit ribosomal protein L1